MVLSIKSIAHYLWWIKCHLDLKHSSPLLLQTKSLECFLLSLCRSFFLAPVNCSLMAIRVHSHQTNLYFNFADALKMSNCVSCFLMLFHFDLFAVWTHSAHDTCGPRYVMINFSASTTTGDCVMSSISMFAKVRSQYSKWNWNYLDLSQHWHDNTTKKKRILIHFVFVDRNKSILLLRCIE